MCNTVYDQFLGNCIPKQGLDPTNYPTIKILLVGEPGVGKTAFVTRQVTGQFQEQYVPTDGMEMRGTRVAVTSSSYAGNVFVMFCDMGGSKDWEVCHKAAFDKVDGVILMANCD